MASFCVLNILVKPIFHCWNLTRFYEFKSSSFLLIKQTAVQYKLRISFR